MTENPIIPSQPIVALGTQSFRVYGLNSEAWLAARRRGRRGDDDDGHHDDDDDDGGGKEEEERKEVCAAVETALKEDAGGFGTAGFHKAKVKNVRRLSINANKSHPASIYRAELVPCNNETGVPLDALQIATGGSSDNNNSNDSGTQDHSADNFSGNDASYLSSSHSNTSITPGRFQIQIKITSAAEGVYTKKYHEALYARGRKATEEGTATSCADEIGGVSIEELAKNDEELGRLKEKVDHCTNHGLADTNHVRFEADEEPHGYYVEIMLLEPHVKDNDVVIGPPSDLDKTTPTFRPRSDASNENISENGCIFQRVYSSRQFTTAPGRWEYENIRAFLNVALDMQKALVRIEFPEFEEGCKDKTFREVFQLNARLKSGSFATVCRGTHRVSGRKIAVKCVLRENLPPNDDAAIYNEVLILSTLRHPLICPLIDFFEERECYFLVMELMSGGDLFDRIGEKKNYTENDARTLCRKMFESLRYCHENSVAHRDLKPKNLLLIDEDDDCAIKLGDFGFATRVYEPCSLTKQCGTPFFIAPEVLLRSPYDVRSDMWSAGVIMYLLLGGDLPFTGRSQKELFRNIIKGEVEFPEEAWGNISPDAKDLLQKLLVTDPSRRITCQEAMASPWMRRRDTMLRKNSLMFTSQRLKTFNARMKLKSAMIAVSAVTSARMSLRKSLNALSLKQVEEETTRQPSFMRLPLEENESSKEVDDSKVGDKDQLSDEEA
eukprot:CCRYP_009771-RA/>CCRYP_009771-RA protein AED:0.10 eAED:0.10 QI:893/1/1/1/1/1/5/672/723